MCEKEVRSGQEDVLADGPSRREFLTTSGGIGAGMLVGGLTGNVQAQEPERGPQPGTGRRILLKGGVVLTMDPELGDLEQANLLIDGARIAEVGPNIQAKPDVIDAAGMIVMPGFIDTHHHQYETIQRSILADGILRGDWPEKTYFSVVQALWTEGKNALFDLGGSPYDPEDNYISELVASLSQIAAGVTTGIDTSQGSHTPEHTDAMIAGLRDSGRRTLYAYSAGRGDAVGYEYPGKIGDSSTGLGRLRSQYFSSDDQLITLALGGSVSVDNLLLARDFDVPLISHAFAGFGTEAIEAVHAAGLMGPDQEYIHCTSSRTRPLRRSRIPAAMSRSRPRSRWRCGTARRRSSRPWRTASCRASAPTSKPLWRPTCSR
jgi:hypothetical protein